jgi:hypothetical protein
MAVLGAVAGCTGVSSLDDTDWSRACSLTSGSGRNRAKWTRWWTLAQYASV